MRATVLAAGGLACAGAAMTIAAFAGGGSSSEKAPGDRAAVSTAPAGGAERGKQVFLQHGCGSCHAFEPAGTSGPIGPDLGLSLDGKSRDDVLEAIVLPNKTAAEDYAIGAMPDDYAERIAPDDLDPLVDFLMQGAG